MQVPVQYAAINAFGREIGKNLAVYGARQVGSFLYNRIKPKAISLAQNIKAKISERIKKAKLKMKSDRQFYPTRATLNAFKADRFRKAKVKQTAHAFINQLAKAPTVQALVNARRMSHSIQKIQATQAARRQLLLRRKQRWPPHGYRPNYKKIKARKTYRALGKRLRF